MEENSTEEEIKKDNNPQDVENDGTEEEVERALENKKKTEEEVEEYLKNEQPGETLEDKAQRVGWIPKEEFHGDLSKYKTPEEYIKMVSSSPYAIKRTLAKKDEEIRSLHRSIQDLSKHISKTNEVQLSTIDIQLENANNKLVRLKDDSDVEGALKTQALIYSLEAQKKNLSTGNETNSYQQPAASTNNTMPVLPGRDASIGLLMKQKKPTLEYDARNPILMKPVEEKYVELANAYGDSMSDEDYANALVIEYENSRSKWYNSSSRPIANDVQNKQTGYEQAPSPVRNYPQLRSTTRESNRSFENLRDDSKEAYYSYNEWAASELKRDPTSSIKKMTKQEWVSSATDDNFR